MIVYVETNFLLELAFEQEGEDACNAILKLAQADSRVRIAVPAFCYSEAVWALRGRRKERHALQSELERTLREIGRSRSFRQQAEGDLARILTQSIQDADTRLKRLRELLLSVGAVLPLTEEVFRKAAEMSEDFGLQESDAVVLATVLLDRASQADAGCFLNRNVKDFDASVGAALDASGCRLINAFTDGMAYIRNALQRLPPP